MRVVRCDLERDMRALDTPGLPAFAEHPGDEGRRSSDLAAEYPQQHLCLAIVGPLVDEESRSSFDLAGPQIALPTSDPDEAQIIQKDIAESSLAVMPEENRFTEAVIRSLGEGARARDATAAIVEPVSGDVLAGNLDHQEPLWIASRWLRDLSA